MIVSYLKVIFFAFACLLLVVIKGHARTDIDERHIKVSMRMIGHKVLLNSGDKISRVLAIEKEDDRYKIQFESPFQFDPSELVTTIEQIVKETEIASSYLVEVERCGSNEVIYSYEIRSYPEIPDLIPCRGRIQPKACYELYITIFDDNQLIGSLFSVKDHASNLPRTGDNKSKYFLGALFIISIFLLMGMSFYFWWRKPPIAKIDPDVIAIGAFEFDKRNMALSFENEKTELTGKEADLLLLLYSSANTTLNREKILQIVWGDQGDYIGRTLDVFISKLRKKLAADASLKIVNIRGIGYKFIMNDRG